MKRPGRARKFRIKISKLFYYLFILLTNFIGQSLCLILISNSKQTKQDKPKKVLEIKKKERKR